MENGQSKEISPDFHLKGSQGALITFLTVPESKKWSMPFGIVLDCCHMNNGPFCSHPFLFQVTMAWDN